MLSFVPVSTTKEKTKIEFVSENLNFSPRLDYFAQKPYERKKRLSKGIFGSACSKVLRTFTFFPFNNITTIFIVNKIFKLYMIFIIQSLIYLHEFFVV